LTLSNPTQQQILDYIASRGNIQSAPIYTLAEYIRSDWFAAKGGINFAAKPYLHAMDGLNSIHGYYYEDSNKDIVSRFLTNASTWKGPVARLVKAELRRRLKEAG
jgi:hypothetical protein